MEIVIEELNPENVKDVNSIDGEFDIDAKLSLYVEDNQIRYEIIKTSPTKKRYQLEEIDYRTYLDDPHQTIFLAKVEGQVAGQVILRKNWNAYAYIEDLAVDIQFRRQGIGQQLISQAEQWARVHHLKGIMLETQNNNVGACRFYEQCDFRLGGFDQYLYQGQNPATDEIALYWYLLFEDLHPTHESATVKRQTGRI